MREAGVPIVPGGPLPLTDVESMRALADEIGYPVMVKAAAGGGGRGMRLVGRDADLAAAVSSATAEAVKAFGDGGVYVEKYIERPRHIEFQVLADAERTVHLGERECSVQRRHQKLVEEAPSVAMTPELREWMGAAAVAAAEARGLSGRRHLRVPPRRRPLVLFPRDEYANPGGAHHHRDGVWDRPGTRAAPHRLGPCRCAYPRVGSTRAAGLSNAGSPAKIPRTAFSRPPDGSATCARRRGRESGGTAASRRETR